MRMWPKRKPSSPGSSAWSGRISSLRTSVSRCAPTSARSGSASRAATAPRWKSRPSIDAALEHGPLVGSRAGRCGRRAAPGSSAGPRARRSRSPPACASDLLDEERVALGRLDDRARASPAARSSRSSLDERLAVRRRPAARARRGSRSARRRPGRAYVEEVGPGACRGRGSATPARRSRRTRSGRAASARPSGCRRRRRRAALARERLEQPPERPRRSPPARRRVRLRRARPRSAPSAAALVVVERRLARRRSARRSPASGQ